MNSATNYRMNVSGIIFPLWKKQIKYSFADNRKLLKHLVVIVNNKKLFSMSFLI